MLRKILGAGRRLVVSSEADTNDSTTEASSSTSNENPHKHLEPWTLWISRVTHSVEHAYANLGLKSWLELYHTRKFRWAGHFARRHDGRWTSKSCFWKLVSAQGRRQSKPKMRWDGDIQKFVMDVCGYEAGKCFLFSHRTIANGRLTRQNVFSIVVVNMLSKSCLNNHLVFSICNKATKWPP